MQTASPCQVFQSRAPVSSGGTTQTPILTRASCFFNRWWLSHLFSSGPGLTIPSGHQRVLEPRLLLRQAGPPPGVELGPGSGAWLPARPADSPGCRQTRPSAWPLGGSGSAPGMRGRWAGSLLSPPHDFPSSLSQEPLCRPTVLKLRKTMAGRFSN